MGVEPRKPCVLPKPYNDVIVHKNRFWLDRFARLSLSDLESVCLARNRVVWLECALRTGVYGLYQGEHLVFAYLWLDIDQITAPCVALPLI